MQCFQENSSCFLSRMSLFYIGLQATGVMVIQNIKTPCQNLLFCYDITLYILKII